MHQSFARGETQTGRARQPHMMVITVALVVVVPCSVAHPHRARRTVPRTSVTAPLRQLDRAPAAFRYGPPVEHLKASGSLLDHR